MPHTDTPTRSRAVLNARRPPRLHGCTRAVTGRRATATRARSKPMLDACATLFGRHGSTTKEGEREEMKQEKCKKGENGASRRRPHQRAPRSLTVPTAAPSSRIRTRSRQSTRTVLGRAAYIGRIHDACAIRKKKRKKKSKKKLKKGKERRRRRPRRDYRDPRYRRTATRTPRAMLTPSPRACRERRAASAPEWTAARAPCILTVVRRRTEQHCLAARLPRSAGRRPHQAASRAVMPPLLVAAPRLRPLHRLAAPAAPGRRTAVPTGQRPRRTAAPCTAAPLPKPRTALPCRAPHRLPRVAPGRRALRRADWPPAPPDHPAAAPPRHPGHRTWQVRSQREWRKEVKEKTRKEKKWKENRKRKVSCDFCCFWKLSACSFALKSLYCKP